MQCSAKAKSTGEQCRRSAKDGFNVCRVHGAGGGAPRENQNAVRHGAYGQLIRDRLSPEERAAFDAVSVETSLQEELRTLRFKFLALAGQVDQNVHGKDGTWVVKADDFEKARGLGYLAGEIRKLVKDMKEVGTNDPLAELVDAWKEGIEADETAQQETGAV